MRLVPGVALLGSFIANSGATSFEDDGNVDVALTATSPLLSAVAGSAAIDFMRFHSTATGAFHQLRKSREVDHTSTSTSTSGGGLRLLTGENSCKDKLDTCRTNLEECQSKSKNDSSQEASPNLLAVQMAQTCKLKRIRKNGKTRYEWSSKDMDDDTYLFSDRPYRIAGTEATKRFFKAFGDSFGDDSGGRPNGVITFRHEDDDAFEGPLISVFVDAAYQKESGKFVYELSQSQGQEEVNALEDFFPDGDGKDNGVVEYEMCSVFLDNSAYNNCEFCTLDECNIFYSECCSFCHDGF